MEKTFPSSKRVFNKKDTESNKLEFIFVNDFFPFSSFVAFYAFYEF